MRKLRQNGMQEGTVKFFFVCKIAFEESFMGSRKRNLKCDFIIGHFFIPGLYIAMQPQGHRGWDNAVQFVVFKVQNHFHYSLVITILWWRRRKLSSVWEGIILALNPWGDLRERFYKMYDYCLMLRHLKFLSSPHMKPRVS